MSWSLGEAGSSERRVVPRALAHHSTDRTGAIDAPKGSCHGDISPPASARMKRREAVRHFIVASMLAASAELSAAAPLKVFVSVDMEGLAAVFADDQVSQEGLEYPYFREVMTREANAAVAGAFAAGASEVLVRDTHGGMRHLLPELLDKRVRLVRGPTHPQSLMVTMEGFDGSYGAVVLIGYHARSGYPNAVLPHTMTSNVLDYRINGISQSEASYSALIAGRYDVPVVMISGDKAACEDAAETLKNGLETVVVKEAINGGIISIHPEVAQARIRAAVERGVRRRAQIAAYKLPAPYTVTLKREQTSGSWIPGARLNARGEIELETADLPAALNALVQLW
jgi:D-amino peptidase